MLNKFIIIKTIILAFNILNASEIGFEIREPSIKVKRLFFPARSEKCEMIVGEDLADAAQLMVLRLREENII